MFVKRIEPTNGGVQHLKKLLLLLLITMKAVSLISRCFKPSQPQKDYVRASMKAAHQMKFWKPKKKPKKTQPKTHG